MNPLHRLNTTGTSPRFNLQQSNLTANARGVSPQHRANLQTLEIQVYLFQTQLRFLEQGDMGPLHRLNTTGAPPRFNLQQPDPTAKAVVVPLQPGAHELTQNPTQS